ncbi:MAG: hypothetical protein KDI56_09275 [Xanthomonadales bacterium]|nr:hypothetical protein [Xanthomonadales bacterium]
MEAEQIFLFSITGLNVAQAKESSELRGSLRVEKIYRGAPPAATFIFSDSMWCGTRLVTGHRYLAFIAGPGKPLVLDDGTLLDLAAIGSDSQALADWLVTQILDGSSTGDEAWWQQSWTSLQIVPPPLPPQGAEHE